MDKKQKKTWIITMSVIFAVLTLLCPFFNLINPKIVDIFADKFSVISSKHATMVHFLSIGQGDAVAINLPDGKVMLIDAGLQDSNVTYTDYLNEKVLNNKRNKKVDYLVLTHAHADHIGATLRLLKNFEIGTIYMPIMDVNTTMYKTLIEYINSKNYTLISADAATDILLDKYQIKFFPPVISNNENDSCPMVKLIVDNKSFLFTGDISTKAEQLFVEKYGEELDSDILKVAHHGSAGSSSLEFLSAVSPKYAVITCGKNSYGFPTEQVLDRLSNVGAEVLRTDTQGSILFTKSINYDLSIINGSYTITSLSLDYRILILILDGIIIVSIVDILIRKPKKQFNPNLVE